MSIIEYVLNDAFVLFVYTMTGAIAVKVKANKKPIVSKEEAELREFRSRNAVSDEVFEKIIVLINQYDSDSSGKTSEPLWNIATEVLSQNYRYTIPQINILWDIFKRYANFNGKVDEVMATNQFKKKLFVYLSSKVDAEEKITNILSAD